MPFHAKTAVFSAGRNRLSVFSKYLKGSACIALFLVAAGTNALADGRYYNADGSRTDKLDDAIASWQADKEFQRNWGTGAVNAAAAFARGYTGAGVTIGMVDSGYQEKHEAFNDKNAGSILIQGSYKSDGFQVAGSNRDTWKAGDPFIRNPVPGTYISKANDGHGTSVAGILVAARDGKGMMGIAHGARMISANTNGDDRTTYGGNLDYNYFKQVYDGLGKTGAKIINNSFGTPPLVGDKEYDNFAVVDEIVKTKYGTGESYLDAAVETVRDYGLVQVWSNGNTSSRANGSSRAMLPYYDSGLEANWLAATGLQRDGDQTYAKCGIGKYWCIAGPGPFVTSANEFYLYPYNGFSGTSSAAPHISASLAVIMERFSYLAPTEARQILLTTATHKGKSPEGIPNEVYGWGVPNLETAMLGPRQLLGKFVADLPQGTKDVWSNDISDAALMQRKQEEQTEMASWPTRKLELQNKLQTVPDMMEPRAPLIAGLNKGKDLLKAVLLVNTRKEYTGEKIKAAVEALEADPVGKELLKLYEKKTAEWRRRVRVTSDFDDFIEGRSDDDLAKALASMARDDLLAANHMVENKIQFNDNSRIPYLTAKLADPSSYDAGLTKTGSGTLILQGVNTYSGETRVDGGLLVLDRQKLGTDGKPMLDTDGKAVVPLLLSPVLVNKKGTFQADGLVHNVVTVNGLLTGTGTVDSLTAKSGGIVSPGNSVGTLNVSKDATFEKGSVLDIEIKPDFLSADQLAVAGKAILLGGAVNVRLENDPALLPEDVTKSLFLKTFDILTASKGVTGQFESVWPQYNYITPFLDYETDKNKLILGFDFTPEAKDKQAREKTAKLDAQLLQAKIDGMLSSEFLAIGVDSRNQKGAWRGIQSLGQTGNELFKQVLFSTVDNPLDFDVLSGEVHATLSGVLAANSHFISDTASARLRHAFGGVAGKAQAVTAPLAYGPEIKAKQSEAFAAVEPAAASTALWGEAYGSWAHADGTAMLPAIAVAPAVLSPAWMA